MLKNRPELFLLQTLLIAAVLITSCGGPRNDTDKYLQFLYTYMPTPDEAAHSEAFWRANVEKTLEVRERMGWNIPEREFLHFVLPLRVNNEPLDDFRTMYADTLCARVAGMPIGEAALEINHWCHEMAIYHPSDGRTSSPLQTIQRGMGRCGEESVLTVAALRAAGIPARQVYAPRWAHTDDNHAWVEVYVDDKWHFMGACEPEPKLDMAWFTGPVSRALLLHTKVFGDYHGDEDVIQRTPCYTEINVIRGYVPARRSVVTVLNENGLPVEDARVEFKIYNYGEYYTVADYRSDSKGQAALDMGYGDMVAWVSKGDRFGLAVIDGESVSVTLAYRTGDAFGLDLDIVPPVEKPLPSGATPAETAHNAERLRHEDSLRDMRPKGNDAVIDAFLAAHNDNNARALLASLSAKDLGDVTADVLEDAYAHIDGEFRPERDCPRIELEALKPYFAELSSALSLGSREDVSEWIEANITLDTQRNPQGLRMSPADVWHSRKADAVSRDIFYIALCRAMGLEAALDARTGDTQQIRHPQGILNVSFEGRGEPEYYYQFTLSKIEDGTAKLLNFDEDSDHTPWTKIFPLSLDEGYYMLTSGTRLADGSVLSHVEFFTVTAGSTVEIPLVMRSAEDRISVLGTMDADRFLPQTGRGYYLLAVLGDRDEPTSHCVRQLGTVIPLLEQWDRPILLAGKAVNRSLESSSETSLGRLSKLIPIDDADGSILEMLTAGCKSNSGQLPVVTICDSFGRIVYFSQGYNTSLAEDLKRVIEQL